MTGVAFIGFGEAGGILAAGLVGAGATVTSAYDILIHDPKKADALIAKAKKNGIAAAASPAEVALDVDVVIAAVVADQTVVAAQSVAAHLKPGQFYLDINSTSPRRKQEAARLIAASGASYIEAAVLNVVPGAGIKVPMLLAGEKAADLAALLTPFGMNLDPIGSEIGTASAVKMVRSVFVKGFNCILLECLVAASRFKVEERILDSLSGSYPAFDWRAFYPRRYAANQTLSDLHSDPTGCRGGSRATP
jgi:3-hydroxyisobutyrate dehydrogenase-like beta-hydroxyacid dehydrogenase